MEWNVASNSELYNERERLEKEFESAKERIKVAYEEMTELAKNYDMINEIINKREGKG